MTAYTCYRSSGSSNALAVGFNLNIFHFCLRLSVLFRRFAISRRARLKSRHRSVKPPIKDDSGARSGGPWHTVVRFCHTVRAPARL